MTQQQELLPHLFRTEFRKITSVLCKIFGTAYIDAAEDIASETFLAAAETWSYQGLPPNPVGWLYAVAKNKAINHIRRENLFVRKIAPGLKQQPRHDFAPDIDLSDQQISDSQLQMFFTVCHPSISPEAQVALALRILCGFGIEEIANAFLTNKETINKRLTRAKEKLRSVQLEIEMPRPAEINKRLETVLATIYLLYNEGYYSESNNCVLREELCMEAIRLAELLLQYPQTNLPPVNALMALMCFHSSRFPARKDESGEIILYHDQDETRWDRQLIAKGAYFLHLASTGEQFSRYHLEAGIAYWHTIKKDTEEKWLNILQLYDLLLEIQYSPIAALNRTFALSKAKGNSVAIEAATHLNLEWNHYYHTLLGELYWETDKEKAQIHLQRAFQLAKTQSDKKIISDKLERLSNLP